MAQSALASATDPSTAGTLPGRVMVMPAYYLPREKKGLSLTALLAIIVGVVVLISLVVVAVLLMNRDSAPAVTP